MWFIYPETANVRLEDMNSIFGDATSVMPTPQTQAEVDSLFSGARSPVASLDLRQGHTHTADSAIPGLNIDPPTAEVEEGRAKQAAESSGERSEGLGGWISNMVRRGKGEGDAASGSGKYKRIEQDDE